MTKHAPILIAGPTASGKSAFALSLAERIGGTIVNADAMQVYRELRVLTARPSPADEARVPHRLYGHVAGETAYSAARFAAEAGAAIREAQAEGRTPIVTGGTGLYFKALLEGLSPIPAIPEEIRSRWRRRAGEEGPAALHVVLTERDPEMAARLRPTDPQRITRALEVLEATGVSLARWQEMPGEPAAERVEGRAFVVVPERDELRDRIDRRFDAMLSEGAVEEVEALMALGLDPNLPIMRVLGVAPLAGYLAGRHNLEQAAEAAKAETRQYAKRQLTWLRRNMISWRHIKTKQTERTVEEIIAFVQSAP
jgi:tRNA dimethylallyltransferase